MAEGEHVHGIFFKLLVDLCGDVAFFLQAIILNDSFHFDGFILVICAFL